MNDEPKSLEPSVVMDDFLQLLNHGIVGSPISLEVFLIALRALNPIPDRDREPLHAGILSSHNK